MARKSPEKAAATRRGRPAVDIAVRVRNWGWYWLVKQESGLTDDQLDARFAPQRGYSRNRRFFQIRALGSSPIERRSTRSECSLYSAVHADGGFPAAQEWFESAVWDLLIPPRPTLACIQQTLQKINESNGWYRATPGEWVIGRMLFEGSEPAYSTTYSKAWFGMVQYFADAKCLDDVAVVAALFREAHVEFRLALADVYSRLCLHMVVKLGHEARIPKKVEALFAALISNRVLRDRWFSEPDMPIDRTADRSSRKRRVRHFCEWYIAKTFYEMQPDGQPIVISTDRTDWVKGLDASVLRSVLPGSQYLRLKRLGLTHGADRKPIEHDILHAAATLLAKEQRAEVVKGVPSVKRSKKQLRRRSKAAHPIEWLKEVVQSHRKSESAILEMLDRRKE